MAVWLAGWLAAMTDSFTGKPGLVTKHGNKSLHAIRPGNLRPSQTIAVYARLCQAIADCLRLLLASYAILDYFLLSQVNSCFLELFHANLSLSQPVTSWTLMSSIPCDVIHLPPLTFLRPTRTSYVNYDGKNDGVCSGN